LLHILHTGTIRGILGTIRGCRPPAVDEAEAVGVHVKREAAAEHGLQHGALLARQRLPRRVEHLPPDVQLDLGQKAPYVMAQMVETHT
jgi:hypothetical protein